MYRICCVRALVERVGLRHEFLQGELHLAQLRVHVLCSDVAAVVRSFDHWALSKRAKSARETSSLGPGPSA